MTRKRYTAEQIIHKLREAEVELAAGNSVPTVCRKLAISEQTYYRWRKQYGGLRINQAKRLKACSRRPSVTPRDSPIAPSTSEASRFRFCIRPTAKSSGTTTSGTS